MYEELGTDTIYLCLCFFGLPLGKTLDILPAFLPNFARNAFVPNGRPNKVCFLNPEKMIILFLSPPPNLPHRGRGTDALEFMNIKLTNAN